MTARPQAGFVNVTCTFDEHIRLCAPGGLIHRVLRAQETNLDWDVTPPSAVLEIPVDFVPHLVADQGELTDLERELVTVLTQP